MFHLLALLEAHHILHLCRIRVNIGTAAKKNSERKTTLEEGKRSKRTQVEMRKESQVWGIKNE